MWRWLASSQATSTPKAIPNAVLDRQLGEAQHVPAAAHRVELAVERLAVVGEQQEAELHAIALAYFGGIRRAPSSRIVSPFSIGLATIAATRSAYSDGRPSRDGNGMPAPSACALLLGQRGEQRRVEEARGDRQHADAAAGEVAGRRQRQPDDAALRGRVGDLADLAVEGGDRGGVDADAALAARRRARCRPSPWPRAAAR